MKNQFEDRRGEKTANRDTDYLVEKFEEFFLQNFPRVKNFARLLLKSEQEAEDVAQDIFAWLWVQPDTWLNQNTRRYLYTITRNHILNRIKHRNVELAYKEEVLLVESLKETFDSPLDHIYYQEILLILKLALEEMPEKRKQVFKMSRFEEMSNVEIAQQLNLSIRTVEHHIYLALSELKKMLITVLFLFSL